MIKRTLYFGNNAYLHIKNKQLIVDFADEDRPQASVPVEDIGVVILDAYRLTISQNLITALLENNVALITCDHRHMPVGLMLNLESHHVQQERFSVQIAASLPLKKQLWQQTVKAKIRNQASLLASNTIISSNELLKMNYWENAVKSGDSENVEGRAAAFYWSKLFSGFTENFKRGRFEPEPNNLLNYGYAILRAVTARSLVASGLLPTFGIHHRNRYNAYALADDIMEPYRPYVDDVVFELLEKNIDKIEDFELELTPGVKKELLKIPAIDVKIKGESSPLMIAMQRTTASLYACLEGSKKKLIYPEI
jgi:CRISPR-associated protein Cas1